MPRSGYAWTAIAVVLLALGFVRAADATTEAGRAGMVIGAALGPLLLAWLIWLFVQRVVRRRPAGFPPWVGVIAIGIGVLAAVPAVRDRAAETSAATMTCVPNAQLYGTAPTGFKYVTLKGADRSTVIKELGLEAEDLGNAEIALAQGREDADTAILVATRRSGPSDGLDEFIAGAEDSGAKVTRDTVAGHDAARIDAADGSKFVAAVKGCHIVLVIAPNERIVQQLAPAVFTT